MTDAGEPDIWADARRQLDRLQGRNLARSIRSGAAAPGHPNTSVYRQVDGRVVSNFSSNDYLDLANHPNVIRAACEAANSYGAGATAARLICGDSPVHGQLEQALAEFKQTEAALLFSSGYMACLGAIQTLRRRADDSQVPVFFDRLSHASLVDACTAGRGAWHSFHHNNVNELEALLDKYASPGEVPSAVVVTEGVFSMDGDLAPLAELSALCGRRGAVLVIDDAHGTGTVGDGGRGSAARAGIAGQAHVVLIGTLSKALGAQGGFVACSQVLRSLMISTARTFIFDTGLAPACAGAALEALRILQREPERIEKLQSNCRLLCEALGRGGAGSVSPVVPIMIGEADAALEAARDLFEQGYLVVAIRPPTVPPNTSRLRVTVSAGHSDKQITGLARAVMALQV